MASNVNVGLHLPGLCSKLSDTTVLTRTPMCRQRETSIFAEAVSIRRVTQRTLQALLQLATVCVATAQSTGTTKL